jgi:hypothetical protein
MDKTMSLVETLRLVSMYTLKYAVITITSAAATVAATVATVILQDQ